MRRAPLFNLIFVALIVFLFARSTFRVAAQETEKSSVAPNKCFAVLVGVDEYESENLIKLDYSSSDVRAIRDALIKLGVPEENIQMFVSNGGIRERPRSERVVRAIDEMLRAADSETTVFVPRLLLRRKRRLLFLNNERLNR